MLAVPQLRERAAVGVVLQKDRQAERVRKLVPQINLIPAGEAAHQRDAPVSGIEGAGQRHAHAEDLRARPGGTVQQQAAQVDGALPRADHRAKLLVAVGVELSVQVVHRGGDVVAVDAPRQEQIALAVDLQRDGPAPLSAVDAAGFHHEARLHQLVDQFCDRGLGQAQRVREGDAGAIVVEVQLTNDLRKVAFLYMGPVDAGL